jgi:hypothetical protein
MIGNKSEEAILLEKLWGDEHLQTILTIINEACKNNPKKGHFIEITMFADHKQKRMSLKTRDEEHTVESDNEDLKSDYI